MFDIEAELKKLPQTPGVYMHKDSLGNVIYVGKAVRLRSRVSQYFRNTSQHSAKVRAMLGHIAEFDYMLCATEMEALILECNLIKKYRPKYNVLLKDGKTYPYIEVTLTERFPRVLRTRQLHRDGNRYFGPYSDSAAVGRLLRMIDEIYPIKKCRTKDFPEGVRPCLNYFIGKCKGVCIAAADEAEYREMIDAVLAILSGKDTDILKEMEKRMREASEALQYEEAAKYRDYLSAFRALGETQRATLLSERDADLLLPVMTGHTHIVARYMLRDGKLVGRELHYLDDLAETDAEELIPAFIQQYYPGNPSLPREILLPEHIEDEALLTALLNQSNAANAAGRRDIAHKTQLLVPKRGKKRALLELAERDAREMAKSLDERALREAEKRDALRERVAALIVRACALRGDVPVLIEDDEREYRVEAYDISNMNGLDAVGAMVVYEGRRAIRSDYRKFRIHTKAAEGDDYASLQEVLYRRLKRGIAGDEGFRRLPDILFIDGGLGQVHAAQQVSDALRIAIPIVGLAKDDAHRTRAIVFADGSEIDLREDPLLFSYAGTVQEEVHRFAVTFQRGRRSRRMTRSALEEIPGIGPARRRELLAHFRSLEAVSRASYAELLSCKGMNSRVAESVLDYFAGQRSKGEASGEAAETVRQPGEANEA